MSNILCEATNLSRNFCGVNHPRKLRENRLFCVISRISQVMILSLAVGILVVGRTGFGESFPDRPTQAEMDEVVRLGTECARGVNERCWATQYQTNPVQYRVSPFTNTAQWYLNQSTMGTIASKARSLVPYYANPDTVYNGTTNITMLTVSGVWAQLAIGDHTNKFTLTPASGTNAAAYGDSPWRIYQLDIEERYKVLNALKITKIHQKAIMKIRAYDYFNFWEYTNWPWATWKSNLETEYFDESSFISTEFLGGLYGFRIFTWAVSPFLSGSSALGARGTEVLGFSPLSSSTQLTYSVQVFYKCDINYSLHFEGGYSPPTPVDFDGYGLNGDGQYYLISGTSFGLPTDNFPNWCENPTTNSTSTVSSNSYGDVIYSEARGVRIADDQTLQTWNFQYCIQGE